MKFHFARLFVCTLIFGSFAGECSAANKPNVLLIISDDLRDHLGCYGTPIVQTPNIDRLAKRGVVFERAYVQYPVCNPSRSSFLSGLRCDQTQVTDNVTLLRSKLPDVVTFPQLLKEHGWHAAAYGKIFHLGGGKNTELRNKWMDLPKSWHEARSFEATTVGKRKIEGRNLTGGALPWCAWGMMDGTDEDQPDGQIAAATIAAIERGGDQPWLIGVGFMKPHDPFEAPRKYFELYPPEKLKLYRDPEKMTPAPREAVGFGDYAKAFDKFTDPERREFQRAYYAGISFIDAQLGRILDTMDQRRLWDNTIVCFISDHGYHLGERNWWNKNTLFERSCRAPLIIAAPGIKPGRAAGLVEFVDLYPTIADYCGVKPPAGLAGQSLRPLLEDASRPGKSSALTIVTRGSKSRGDSIRTDRWRFIQWSDGEQELYDHQNDPEETQNVAKSNPAIVAMHSELLKKMQSER